MRKSIILAALIGLVALSSCKKDSPMGSVDGLNTIPASAALVMAIDVPSLMEKGDFENLKSMEMYQDMLDEAGRESATLKQIMEDPSKSGIDLGQHAYLAVDIDPESVQNVFFGLVFSLADPDAFVDMVTSGDSEITFMDGEGFRYATPDRQGLIAYSDQYAIIGGGSGYTDMQEWAVNFFSTTEETSITSNSNLRKAMKEDHDITVWMTANPFADNQEAKFALSMAEIPPEALRDNYIYGYSDFENGQIVSSTTFDLQRDLTKDFDKFFDDEVDTDYSAYLPKEGLLFAFSVAVNSKGIDEVLSARPQTKGLIDYSLQEYGLSVSDIANTLGGDILFAAMTVDDSQIPAGLFAMNITDDEVFNTLLGMAVDAGELEAESEGVYLVKGSSMRGGPYNELDLDVVYPDGHPRLIFTDDKVFITGHPAVQAVIEAGGYPSNMQAENATQKLVFNHIFGAYAAMKALGDLEPNMPDNVFDRVEVTVDRDGADNIFYMKDDSQNSLRLLLEMLNEAYKMDKEKYPSYDDEDSAM